MTLPAVAPAAESVVSIENKYADADSVRQIFQFQIPDESDPDQYHIAVFSGEYLTKGSADAWACQLDTDPTADAAKIIVTAEGLNFRLQVLPNAGQNRYLGYQSITAGQPCYWDKSGDAALWRLEEVQTSQSSIQVVPANQAIAVYPSVSKGSITVTAPGAAVINVFNIAGAKLASYQSDGNKTFEMNYGNGLYIIRIECNKQIATFKIILNR